MNEEQKKNKLKLRCSERVYQDVPFVHVPNFISALHVHIAGPIDCGES